VFLFVHAALLLVSFILPVSDPSVPSTYHVIGSYRAHTRSQAEAIKGVCHFNMRGQDVGKVSAPATFGVLRTAPDFDSSAGLCRFRSNIRRPENLGERHDVCGQRVASVFVSYEIQWISPILSVCV